MKNIFRVPRILSRFAELGEPADSQPRRDVSPTPAETTREPSAIESAQRMWDYFQDVKNSWEQFVRAHNAVNDGEISTEVGRSIATEANDSVSLGAIFDKNNPIAEQFRKSPSFLALAGKLHKLYSDPEIRSTWEEGMYAHARQWEDVNGNWDRYIEIEKQMEALQSRYSELQKEKFDERGKIVAQQRRTLNDDLAEVEMDLALTRVRRESLRQSSPELAAKILAAELADRHKELTQDGFMMFPSRRSTLEIITVHVLDQNSLRLIVLEGQAGTGKTSFIRRLAQLFTGHKPVEVTVGSRTKMGRELLADETLDKDRPVAYGPILSAITGKRHPEDAPEHKGMVAFVDELNKGENDEIGDLATVLDGMKVGEGTRYAKKGANPDDLVQPQALVVAAQNPAGARFLNRTRFTPEVQRKLTIIQLDYLSQTSSDPELYEAFLVAMMDKDGRIQAQKAELSPAWVNKSIKDGSGQEIAKKDELATDAKQGGVLWRLAQMLRQSYENLNKRPNILTDANPDAKIQGRTLPWGDVMSWLAQYRKEVKKSVSLEGYLSRRFYDWIESSFTADHDQPDKQLYLELAEKYDLVKKNGDKYEALPQKKITIDLLTQRAVAELSPRVPRKEVPIRPKVEIGEFPLAVADLTGPDGTLHRRVEFRYKPDGREFKKDGKTVRFIGRIEKCDGFPEMVGKAYVIEVEKKAIPESETRFTVSNAINPYREAFLAGGIPAGHPEAQERREIEVDLNKTLAADIASYRSSGNEAWALALEAVKGDLRLTSDKKKIIEQEIRDGAMPIFMPGRAAQLATTAQDLQTKFKPVWIKDGRTETLVDAYMWDKTAELIARQASELVQGVPERPYIEFTKPTAIVDSRTTNKTVDQQKDELVIINSERRTANSAMAHAMNPAEYAAFTKRSTETIRDRAPAALSDLTPPDVLGSSYTRFIELPLSAGFVPVAVFHPGDRQVKFVRDGAGNPNSGGGFRLSVRVTI